jgi:hypothetical protein
MIRSSSNIDLKADVCGIAFPKKSALTRQKRARAEKVPIKNPARRPGFFAEK